MDQTTKHQYKSRSIPSKNVLNGWLGEEWAAKKWVLIQLVILWDWQKKRTVHMSDGDAVEKMKGVNHRATRPASCRWVVTDGSQF